MMSRIKHGVVAGVAFTVAGLGLVFSPQARANQGGNSGEMCIREAAKHFQEEMKACESREDQWERHHCMEMARERFEHARHMCQADKGNQGGGGQNGGGGNQGGGNQGGGNQGGGNQGGGNQGGGSR